MTLLNGTDWTSSDFANGAHRTNFPEAVFDDFLAECDSQILAVGSALTATSSSSVTVGTGSKTFTVGTGKGFADGLWLIAFRTSDPTVYMIGQVTGYSGGDVTISVASGETAGAGTFTDWTIGIGGRRGASGDVTGPGSSTDNALVRWGGGGGDAIQDSGWLLGDDDTLDGQDNELIRALLRDVSYQVNPIGTIQAGTNTIDYEDGNVATITGAAVSATLAVDNWPGTGDLGILIAVVTNGGVISSLTHPTGTVWEAGVAPDLTTSGTDIVVYITLDGGATILGRHALNFS